MAKSPSKKQVYESYLGIRRTESAVSYRLDDTPKAIKEWAKTPVPDDDEKHLPADGETAENDGSTSPSLGSDLRAIIGRFTAAMFAFRSLGVVVEAMGTGVRFSAAEQDIAGYAKQHCEEVSASPELTIFGVLPGHTRELIKGMKRSRQIEDGVAALPGAVILSLSAVYDNYFSEVIARLLSEYPDRFDGKSINIKDVMSMSSLSDVIEKVVDEEIDTLMRKSHAEQVSYVESNFKIEIRKHYERWANYVEFFERRNVIAHGNAIVNRHYIKNCNDQGFNISSDKIGSKIVFGSKYISRSADILTEFGLLLMFSLWKKSIPSDTEDVFRAVNESAYELLVNNRPRLASRILDFAVNKQKPDASEMVRKMLTVNLANAYRKTGDVEKSEATLKKFDWATSADHFRICVAAIRGEDDNVLVLMPRVAEMIGKDGFREWPAFDGYKENASFRDKFQELFGEPLLASSSKIGELPEVPA